MEQLEKFLYELKSALDFQALNLSILGGAALAFVLAGVTVLYDCHVSIQQRLKRVPRPVVKETSALVLGLLCGLVAAGAFFFTRGDGSTGIDTILTLKQQNPFLRGICVGLTVLVLIRSKLSSFKGAEIGGELAYNSGRGWVIKSLNSNWRKFKNGFITRNLSSTLLLIDYENQLLAQLRDAIQVEPEDYRVFVEGQITNIQKSRPASAFDSNLIEWRTYYRTLTNLALDYAGPSVFAGWTQFK